MGVFDNGFNPIGGIKKAADIAGKTGGVIVNGAVNMACGIGNAALDAVHQIERNINRPKTPFNFEDGISQDDFCQIANDAASTIKRITSCRCEGPIARFIVKSQSNITEWEFSVDFNAWGHFTGEYWISSSNNESKIPSTIAKRMSESIKSRIP